MTEVLPIPTRPLDPGKQAESVAAINSEYQKSNKVAEYAVAASFMHDMAGVEDPDLDSACYLLLLGSMCHEAKHQSGVGATLERTSLVTPEGIVVHGLLIVSSNPDANCIGKRGIRMIDEIATDAAGVANPRLAYLERSPQLHVPTDFEIAMFALPD